MTGSSAAVVDASVALRAVLPGPQQVECQHLLGRLQSAGLALLAPALWAYETTSGLTRAIRVGLLIPEEGRRALAQLAKLGVQLVPPDDQQRQAALEWTLRLDRAAAYDSFYLALAEALGCDLWTADERLANAAGQPWVRWALAG